MGKYSKGQDAELDAQIDEVLRRVKKVANLDPTNPLEQQMKYKTIKSNPPESGFMEVRCYEGKTDDGEPVVVSESTQDDGKIKKVRHSPFFVVDLNKLLMADITACPSSVGPMLIDMGQRLVELKKDAFKPEKREKEFNWWWIVFLLLLLPGILVLIFMFMPKG